MKKSKLTLGELKISSFVSEMKNVKGGWDRTEDQKWSPLCVEP